MKVQMKARISGLRDGVEWPAPGEMLEVPEAEGAELVANGLALPAPQKVAPEKATAPEPETATTPKPRRARKEA